MLKCGEIKEYSPSFGFLFPYLNNALTVVRAQRRSRVCVHSDFSPSDRLHAVRASMPVFHAELSAFLFMKYSPNCEDALVVVRANGNHGCAMNSEHESVQKKTKTEAIRPRELAREGRQQPYLCSPSHPSRHPRSLHLAPYRTVSLPFRFYSTRKR